jgi:hypothetical protein
VAERGGLDVTGRLSFAALGVAAAGLLWAHGCSSGQADGSTDGGASGESGATGGAAGGSGTVAGGANGGGGTGGTGGCPSAGLPPNVPAGWERFSGYPCDCHIYVPGKDATAPDPVSWEPCPSPGPDNPTCKRMATPWTKTTTLSLSAFPHFWYDKVQDKALLQFGRVFYGDNKNVRYSVVADLDGPVPAAFLLVSPANSECEFFTEDVRQDKFAIGVTSTPANFTEGKPEGVIAGTVGATPSVGFEQPIAQNSYTSWFVSSDWLINARVQIHARPWDLSSEHLVYDPSQDPDNMPAHNLQAYGGAIFWDVGSGDYHGIMSWTLAGGARPLVRWYGDYTKGAGGFNTDGVDMVWTYGEGKAPSDIDYPTRSIMTAPFTTDPAEVASTAKRLRSDPGPFSSAPWGIGCGYATFALNVPAATDGGDASTALLVVRLSDGVSWIVSGPTFASGMHFAGPLGSSCTDVFAVAQFPDDAVSVVRIRLDSLGPGIPPD